MMAATLVPLRTTSTERECRQKIARKVAERLGGEVLIRFEKLLMHVRYANEMARETHKVWCSLLADGCPSYYGHAARGESRRRAKQAQRDYLVARDLLIRFAKPEDRG